MRDPRAVQERPLPLDEGVMAMGQSGVVDWATKKGVVGRGVNEQTLTQRRFFLYFILATENWMET